MVLVNTNQVNCCLLCGGEIKLITYNSAWGEEYDLRCISCGNMDMEKMRQTIWND